MHELSLKFLGINRRNVFTFHACTNIIVCMLSAFLLVKIKSTYVLLPRWYLVATCTCTTRAIF